MIFYDMIKKKIVLHKFFSIKKVFWEICTKMNKQQSRVARPRGRLSSIGISSLYPPFHIQANLFAALHRLCPPFSATVENVLADKFDVVVLVYSTCKKPFTCLQHMQENSHFDPHFAAAATRHGPGNLLSTGRGGVSDPGVCGVRCRSGGDGRAFAKRQTSFGNGFSRRVKRRLATAFREEANSISKQPFAKRHAEPQ
jgi:hypothetical protein